MKRIFTALAVAAIALSACTGNKATVDLTLIGAADSTKVYLVLLDLNRLDIVDSLYTDASGKAACTFSLPDSDPNFYYLYSDSAVRLASLVLLPGDKVSVTTNAAGNPCTIEGSSESALLEEADQQLGRSLSKFIALGDELEGTKDPARIAQIKTEMGKVYVSQKQAALRHVMGNPFSITAISVLSQLFSPELPVFNQATDAVVFKMVCDSLSAVYPSSRYLVSLKERADRLAGVLDIQSRIDQAEVLPFPQIAMPDVNGVEHKLTDLEGKVILLVYWSVGLDEFKMFNHDLKEVYEKYHDRGLEIYMVSLDIDKSEWATVVRNQELPWINVNDGKGTESPSVAAYYVQKIPTMYIIDREGNVPYADAFDKDALEKVVKELL